jgi:hypothetical protein
MPGFDFGPRVDLGSLFITESARDTLPHDEVQAALRRHVRGDWQTLTFTTLPQ